MFYTGLCLVMVERLFLAVPRGCLWLVIVVFPDHTQLIFSKGSKMKEYSSLKRQCLEPWYLVCSIILWTSTKFVQIVAVGKKWPRPRGHRFYIGFYRDKHEKIFLSETTRLI